MVALRRVLGVASGLRVVRFGSFFHNSTYCLEQVQRMIPIVLFLFPGCIATGHIARPGQRNNRCIRASYHAV
jgi:hypothetical protein